MLEVYGKEKLKREIRLNKHKAIILVGDAGTGKTVAIEEYAKEVGEKLISYRMQGIDPTDVQGIPFRNEKDGYLEYLKPKQIKDVIDNPEEKVILFVDEVNRAEPEMLPILFQLFEKKIDNKKYPNLTVIAAINAGEDYDVNINFEEDKALLRRCTFLKYTPQTKGILNYAEEHNYHSIITDVMKRLDGIFWDYNTEGEENAFEAPTTLGSFYDWNNYISAYCELEKMKAEEIDEDLMLEIFREEVRDLYFNNVIGSKVFTILATAQKIKDINIQKDIIIPGRIPDKYKEYKEELLMKVKEHVLLNSKKENYISENFENVIKILKENRELLFSLINDIFEKNGSDIAAEFLELLDPDNNALHAGILETINSAM